MSERQRVGLILFLFGMLIIIGASINKTDIWASITGFASMLFGAVLFVIRDADKN